MERILFYLTIFLSHIIQGVTGFAGTLLAMPFSMKLVGVGTAVPVLNGLGLASGIYVFIGNREKVVKEEIKRVVILMIPFMILGVYIRHTLRNDERLLQIILGIIVLIMAFKGILSLMTGKDDEDKHYPEPVMRAILMLSGVVHGMFVCGGPLLVAYMTDRIKNKDEFRATISTIWIILNGILLIIQLFSGDWNKDILITQIIALPVLFLAMYIGSILYKRMSRRTFMIITYVLLVISGLSLLM
ncbi:MAG: sulfite exporter TauE/SafE family protein [Firmicutes bacterium]|nr:sulfite exporter TauE/SafE family protein [Bacillota bacterium]